MADCERRVTILPDARPAPMYEESGSWWTPFHSEEVPHFDLDFKKITEPVRVPDSRNWCEGNRLGSAVDRANIDYHGISDIDASRLASDL